MKKSFKILSFVISIFIFISFVGNNRVKAVSAGAVLGAGAIVACVGAIASLIANDSVDLVQSGSSVGGYTVDASSYRASSIIDSYLSQYDISSIDDIDDINILIEITDPQKFIDYCGGLDSFTSDEYTAYYTISHIHYEAQNNKFFTDVSGLIFSPDTFSDIVNSVSSDVISEITGKNATVSSTENGLRTLIISGETLYFSELAEQYGASMVWRGDHILPSGIPDVNYYVCFLISYKNVIYAPTRMYHSFVHQYYTSYLVPNTWPFAGFSYDTPRLNSDLNYNVINWFTYSDNTFDSRAFFSISSRDCFSVSSGSCLRDAVDSDDPDLFRIYAFFFPNSILSEKFISDMTSRSVDVDVSDIEKDNVSTYDIPLSDTEKKVGAYEQDHPGVDDIDIVVNPGAVKADDGTTTYNPSISVNDTPLDDIDVTGYLDLDDTLDRFQLPSSISTKFPFSLPFDIYNLFNVFSADPVTPKFTVPLDMTSVGGEVYNIDIDLSDFDDIANIVRWLLYGLFLIGLIILTNKLIGRG